MRVRYFVFLLAGLIVMCRQTQIMAQTTQSPYTALGIGDIIQPQLVPNMGMGASSVAYPSYKNFNLLNPAMLGLRTYFTSFEIGMIGETRSIQKDTLNQRNGSGNLSYLALAFPIKQSKISSGFGLAPYSYMNYNIVSNNPIEGQEESAEFNFTGSGGMNSVFWSTGFNLFNRLALGVKISYLFGARVEETIVDINQPNSYVTAFYEQTKVNDFSFAFGAGYDIRLGNKSEIIIAGIYELEQDLKATRQERLERRQPNTGTVLTSDTILSDTRGRVKLPLKYGIGISYIYGNKWLVSADVVAQNWNDFTNFEKQENFLTKSYRTGVGIEFIPDAASVSSYFDRITYRAGISYELTPYMVNNEQVYDFGINFGVSLPVINLNSPSLVSLAFQYGQRSGGFETPITENYFRVALGFTINDIWFFRRKIE